MKAKRVIAVLAALLAASVWQTAQAEDKAKQEVAVTCPKCETTWVTRPDTVGKMTVYRTEKKMSCEDCTSAVANFFKTGKFEHACKTCGELTACKVHQVEAKPAAATATADAKDGAVMCPKCQAVWVRKSKDLDKRTVYWMEKKPACDGCQTAAMDMLNTDKASGKCAKCGDELKACTH
jgi:Zn-finger nucleic acid-binding protein